MLWRFRLFAPWIFAPALNGTLLFAVLTLGGCMWAAGSMDEYNRRDNQARREFGVAGDWTCLPESEARVGQNIYEMGRDATVMRVVGIARGVCPQILFAKPYLVEVRVSDDKPEPPR